MCIFNVVTYECVTNHYIDLPVIIIVITKKSAVTLHNNLASNYNYETLTLFAAYRRYVYVHIIKYGST